MMNNNTNNHNNTNSENLSNAVHNDQLQSIKKKIQIQTNKSLLHDQKITQIQHKIQQAKQRIQSKKLKLSTIQQQVIQEKQKGQLLLKQPIIRKPSLSSQQPNSLYNLSSLGNDHIVSQLREHFKALKMQMMAELQDYSDDEYQDEVDVDNMTYEQLLQLGERIGKVSKGLDSKKLQCLQVKKYHCQTKGQQLIECAICRQQLQQGCQYMQLPCKHIFHSQCIKGWLNVEKHCPNCKRQISINNVDTPTKTKKQESINTKQP